MSLLLFCLCGKWHIRFNNHATSLSYWMQPEDDEDIRDYGLRSKGLSHSLTHRCPWIWVQKLRREWAVVRRHRAARQVVAGEIMATFCLLKSQQFGLLFQNYCNHKTISLRKYISHYIAGVRYVLSGIVTGWLLWYLAVRWSSLTAQSGDEDNNSPNTRLN